MHRILILDDDPYRHEAFKRLVPGRSRIKHAYTAKQAISALDELPAFDVAFLDHDLPKSRDLAGVADPGSGLDVAKHIAAMNPRRRPTQVWIHSHNPTGRRQMAKILRAAGVETVLQRFQDLRP